VKSGVIECELWNFECKSMLLISTPHTHAVQIIKIRKLSLKWFHYQNFCYSSSSNKLCIQGDLQTISVNIHNYFTKIKTK
jgi:hypothetical protein